MLLQLTCGLAFLSVLVHQKRVLMLFAVSASLAR